MENRDNIIKPEEVIIKGKELDLGSLGELREFLEARQALFENRLANLTISAKRSIGWQELRFSEDDLTEKPIGTPSHGLFTGAGLCGFASGGLIEGLTPHIRGIELNALQMDTDTFAEDWDKTETRIAHPHVIVRARDKDNQAFYIDPTYGQINHQEAGKIIISSKDELQTRYAITPVSPGILMTDVTTGVKRTIASAISGGRLSQDKYQALIDSLR